MKDESVIEHAETKESKEETVIKKVPICMICSQYKAKHNCMFCNKMICVSCRRFLYNHGKPELCRPCFDAQLRVGHDRPNQCILF